MGPVELLVLKFPGNHFTGEILPALRELVDSDTIGIVDIMLAVTDEDGNVSAMEISDDRTRIASSRRSSRTSRVC